MFETELSTYNKEKSILLQQYPTGGFVVIKGNEVLGVWLSRGDALKEGYTKYGNVPFLVKDIRENNLHINFTRNLTFA